MQTDRCGNTRRQKCCTKGSAKKLKYKSLCIEIQRMWNLKCTIVPVIIEATGIVTRSLKKHLKTVPGKHSIDSLQKTAILGTSHIIRKVLQYEAWSLSAGDHRWFKRSTRKKCLWQETYLLYNSFIAIRNGMKKLKIENWTSCIQDRNKWKSYVEKAKTFKDRSCSAWRRHIFDKWEEILNHKKGAVKLQHENIYPKILADRHNWRTGYPASG